MQVDLITHLGFFSEAIQEKVIDAVRSLPDSPDLYLVMGGIPNNDRRDECQILVIEKSPFPKIPEDIGWTFRTKERLVEILSDRFNITI